MHSLLLLLAGTLFTSGTKCHPCPRDHGKNATPEGPCLEPPKGRRPEGGSRQGPEGVGIIFHEPKGMGWHFVIINRQAGLLLHFKMPWVSYALTM